MAATHAALSPGWCTSGATAGHDGNSGDRADARGNADTGLLFRRHLVRAGSDGGPFTRLAAGGGCILDSGDLAQALRKRGFPVDEEWVGARQARAVYQCAVALVRPDGVVAWRGDAAPSHPEQVVDQVTGHSATQVRRPTPGP